MMEIWITDSVNDGDTSDNDNNWSNNKNQGFEESCGEVKGIVIMVKITKIMTIAVKIIHMITISNHDRNSDSKKKQNKQQ